ncbi:MAG: type I-G CRISPR-associated protein, Cas3-extension family [Trebonia sp.]
MTEIPLPALEGTNPLGFLAALGVLDALSATIRGVTLRWTDDVLPNAVIDGPDDLDQLLESLDNDRDRWTGSAVLRFPADGQPLADVKTDGRQLRQWLECVGGRNGDRVDADLLCALVAEDAFDNNGRAKPTHLHFTAGQQKFLTMVRELAAGVDRDRLREAVCGPWRYDSALPSLSWDARGERVYAVRAVNPSNEKRLGVPGADWLAFRGLIFYPVTRSSRGALRTTACDTAWKSSAFRWPLWTRPVSRQVVRSLVADPTLVSRDPKATPADLAARGIASVREASIRRSDQGGYGSFGAPDTLVSAYSTVLE